MEKKEKASEEITIFQNLAGSSKKMGHVAQGGLMVAVIGLLLKFFFYTCKAQGIKGTAGDIFEGIGDFFGLLAFLGFGVLLIGLLSIAIVGKDVHLYLRIGIMVALAFMIRGLLTFGLFF
ncbi:MAG: hypothetical protein JXA22_10820 [Candidatus Thermoplasmatota archaeon]|nr:hypothetical protein [Candidatus Thermoplasmatota archaeon]